MSNNLCNVLNVAEKPSVAVQILKAFQKFNKLNKCSTLKSHSKYNSVKLLENCIVPLLDVGDIRANMIISSVCGHLLTLSLPTNCQNWNLTDPLLLFTVELQKVPLVDSITIIKNLQTYSKLSKYLIIWTDCDKEGENIGEEINIICRKINHNIITYRARFSTTAYNDIVHALHNLTFLNKLEILTVNLRQELDFRYGIAMTRLLTTKLPSANKSTCISFGPCQFPCLVFVVDRFLQKIHFQAELFYVLKLKLNIKSMPDAKATILTLNHHSKYSKCYDIVYATLQYKKLLDNPTSKITKLEKIDKVQLKPLPLNTINLLTISSSILKISSSDCIKIAEKLYCMGLISYPRTETQQFASNFDHKIIIELFKDTEKWGSYSTKLLSKNNFNVPRVGKANDNAHPPIHPVSYSAEITGRELLIYDLVVAHYLACCSKNSIFEVTKLEVCVAKELFNVNFTIIKEANFLEIYKFYDRPNTSTINIDFINNMSVGDVLEINSLTLEEQKTCAPNFLTESELLTLLDNYSIGTDATIFEHIKTIHTRNYVTSVGNGQYKPTDLGLFVTLVLYNINVEFVNINIRKNFEIAMKRICEETEDAKIIKEKYMKDYYQISLAAKQYLTNFMCCNS